MDHERLERQIRFLLEIDKLKSVLRQTILTDFSRQENSVEHSWHVAVMALLFQEYAAERNLELFRAVRMLLIHDLVEIDAGDTFCYDEAANAVKAEREVAAADRIFALLPADQARELRALWDEFEAGETPESRFAAALDRLQPLLHNWATRGERWQYNDVRSTQVIERNRPIGDGAPDLWAYAARLIEDAVERGYLAP